MSVFFHRLILVVAFFTSLHQKVNSKCSKSCVHFKGASSIDIDVEDSYCKSGIYSGKDYYSAQYGSTYLFFDRRTKSWSVAYGLGSTTVKALVYDTAEDPTDISSTWKTVQSHASHSTSDVEYVAESIPNENIKVKCGKYENTGFTVGVSVGGGLVFVLIGVGICICCRRNKQLWQSGRRRTVTVRNVREDTVGDRRRRSPARMHANLVLPPSYEEAIREGIPHYISLNTTGASHNTDSLDSADLFMPYSASSTIGAYTHVATHGSGTTYAATYGSGTTYAATLGSGTAYAATHGSGTMNAATYGSGATYAATYGSGTTDAATHGSGTMNAEDPSNESTENVSTVADTMSCDLTAAAACSGESIRSAGLVGVCSSSAGGGMAQPPPETQLETSDADEWRNKDTVIAVGVSEDSGTNTSSDTQLLIA